jgi:putative spermidine/putrescine transport system ATP-binding protein
MTDPKTLTMRNVVKTYGDVRALDDVSLEVAEGELVALLGSSGCGKTTLLRSAAGLADVDSGQILIGSRDVTHVATRHRPIGMVFQDYALFPNMTVADNIAFPLRVRKEDRAAISARVGEMVELVGLSGKEKRYPNQLSGGQKQRVALARALAPSPALLLLDEPLSALDAVIRESLRDELRRIQQQVGITTLFVTHDQTEALAISDRVAVMSHGRIVECATPAAIYDAPDARYTAEFVGSRNALELPVVDGKVTWQDVFSLPGPDGASSALAVFRSEDLYLVGGDEGFKAEVEVSIFLGSRSRLHVRSNGTPLAVDVSSREAATIGAGDVVHLRIQEDAVRLYPA